MKNESDFPVVFSCQPCERATLYLLEIKINKKRKPKIKNFSNNFSFLFSWFNLNTDDDNDGLYLFVIGRKGGTHLVHNDFIYRSNMKRQGRNLNKMYWECIHNRSIKCRGRVKSVGNKLFVTNGLFISFFKKKTSTNNVFDLGSIETGRKKRINFGNFFCYSGA